MSYDETLHGTNSINGPVIFYLDIEAVLPQMNLNPLGHESLFLDKIPASNRLRSVSCLQTRPRQMNLKSH
jgi:hypothetical protein